MLNKSQENWVVGTHCLESGSTNVAASRLYYAVFQAILGYATAKQGYVYKGFGVHSDMWKVVRSQGKARQRYSELLDQLMALRITADYDRETPDAGEIRDILAETNAMRQYYLSKAGS